MYPSGFFGRSAFVIILGVVEPSAALFSWFARAMSARDCSDEDWPDEDSSAGNVAAVVAADEGRAEGWPNNGSGEACVTDA